MRFLTRSKWMGGVLVVSMFAAFTGCSSLNKTQKGGIIGGAAGAAVGGAIGANNGSTAKGAIIGAVIGGTAGALIGNKMDQRAKQLRTIPGATVERVGEGIQVTFDSGVLFDYDSDVIRGSARDNLNQLARSLADWDDSDLMIVGHTDDKGTDSYNQSLSERRAAAAARYLTARGVERRIVTVGRGEAEPVASNGSDSGRARNRRVEIAIYASEELQKQAKREANAG